MYFLVTSGLALMNSLVSEADPPNHGAIAVGSPRMYLEMTPASRMRVMPLSRPTVPVGSSVYTASIWFAAIDATCWPIGNSITVASVTPLRSSTVLHNVTFWMPGPDPTRLPFSSEMALYGASLATRNSSSTFLTLLGLEQMILSRPGEAISQIARLAEPVPLAL